jgi:hypothetical protein
MRHFAVESGKSKGQFLTSAEVSLIMARIIGISTTKTSAATTVSDPTCGSGSLLLKVAHEARTPVTLYGQEKDSATAVLARMNIIPHNPPTESIVQDRLTKGKQLLDQAIEQLALLCEPVESPKGEMEHIHYFCGNVEIPSDLNEREPQRSALYRGTESLVRGCP